MFRNPTSETQRPQADHRPKRDSKLWWHWRWGAPKWKMQLVADGSRWCCCCCSGCQTKGIRRTSRTGTSATHCNLLRCRLASCHPSGRFPFTVWVLGSNSVLLKGTAHKELSPVVMLRSPLCCELVGGRGVEIPSSSWWNGIRKSVVPTCGIRRKISTASSVCICCSRGPTLIPMFQCAAITGTLLTGWCGSYRDGEWGF